MHHVAISGLTKTFDGKPPTVAIDDLDLHIEQGEFLVLLGPSGCGKTTTLRCLAGLESADKGHISLGSGDVFDPERGVDLPANKRNVGMVFQSYALWPHLRVRDNIAFPLRARRISVGLNDGWVERTAEIVDCAHLLDRYPAQLSGGQQQRVALARGIVARPDLVLFDEPLSNLDARLRDEVRSQLHELHRELGFTAVFVTHDQSEALALADRLAIMRSGRIEQLASPEDVYERPATEYVSAFMGMENRLPVECVDGRAWCHGVAVDGLALPTESAVVRLRPGDLQLSGLGDVAPVGMSQVPVHVVDSTFGGRHVDVYTALGESRFHSRVPSGPRGSWARSLEPGQAVMARFDAQTGAIFDARGRPVDLTAGAAIP